MKRTIAYIDGYNLYYGLIRGTSYKWLDLVAFVKSLLNDEHEIVEVRYFTARPTCGVPSSAGTPDWQQGEYHPLPRKVARDTMMLGVADLSATACASAPTGRLSLSVSICDGNAFQCLARIARLEEASGGRANECVLARRHGRTTAGDLRSRVQTSWASVVRGRGVSPHQNAPNPCKHWVKCILPPLPTLNFKLQTLN